MEQIGLPFLLYELCVIVEVKYHVTPHASQDCPAAALCVARCVTVWAWRVNTTATVIRKGGEIVT